MREGEEKVNKHEEVSIHEELCIRGGYRQENMMGEENSRQMENQELKHTCGESNMC